MEYDGRASSIKLYSADEVAEIEDTSSHNIGHVSSPFNRRESDYKKFHFHLFFLEFS